MKNDSQWKQTPKDKSMVDEDNMTDTAALLGYKGARAEGGLGSAGAWQGQGVSLIGRGVHWLGL